MKENRKSEGRNGTSQIFEFFHQRPENLVTVEKNETGVRICAAYDNFSARDREFFVRHLADEGFIPDRYRWFSDECGWGAALGVEWRISDSHVRTDLGVSAASRRAQVS